jgi:hypothetical protein
MPLQDNALEAYESKLGDAVAKFGVLRRLLPYVELDKDGALIDPMDLIDALYPRVRLAYELNKNEASGSWDYCKVAVRDWLLKTPRWIPIHHDAYWYQIGCVPPAFQRSYMTMTGEAYSGAWHLTLLERGSDSFWCCMLKKSMVVDPSVIARIPFADIPVLGVPAKEEVES